MRVKAKDLLAMMRQRIIAGDLKPGSRLPTKLALAASYGASAGTVQKVLDALTEEGFIHSRGCLGTYVRERPPNLAHLGVVFANGPENNIWTRTLSGAIARVTERDHRWLSCYYNCWRGSKAMQRLESDVARSRLAGILFCTSPTMLAGSPVLEAPNLSRVFVGPDSRRPDIPTVRLTPAHPLALDYFVQDGRRRLAIITTFNLYRNRINDIVQEARDRGLKIERRWIHYFDPRTDITARAVCELMMTLPAGNRPDAVYITDDHLVREATLGIADSRIPVPDQVRVVAHANFPQPEPASVPVTYVGYNLDQVLARALELIDCQAAKKAVPPAVSIDPAMQQS